MLQQLLPFTVLKHFKDSNFSTKSNVATALTVYGIETLKGYITHCTSLYTVATALTVYGIETQLNQ